MYDVVIVGGGPAGTTAALRARELGARAALIERGRMGGTCTNDGCVPTRVLAKTARLLRDAAQMGDYGLQLPAMPTVDFGAVMARTQQVVYQIHEKKQLLAHLRAVGVDVFAEAGDAHFTDAHTLQLADGRTVQGERIVLCVGGHARRLDFPGAEYALTHSDVWALRTLPRHVVVVGGGATGAQLASVFEAFGSTVTLLELAPRLLLSEDVDVANAVEAAFARNGINVLTGIDGLDAITRNDAPGSEAATTVHYRHHGEARTVPADAVILSVGWPGNIDALRLDAAGVDTVRAYVRVNDAQQTSQPHIFAAGDITGRMMLVQSASAQARVAVENALLSFTQASEHVLVPHGGFTDPEYGGVGLTEEAARRQMDVVVAKVPYAAMDRAVIDGHTEGFCKLLVNRKSMRVVGAHVVGEQAVELVSMVSAGMAGGLLVQELAALELAYPTFAAVVGLAAREITRELGIVRMAPSWRELSGGNGAEWERAEELAPHAS